MNITILPYMDTSLLEKSKKTTPVSESNPAAVSFDETLNTAKRALNAMTADLAIAEAKQSGANGFDLNSDLAVTLGISNYGNKSSAAETASDDSTVNSSSTTGSSSAANSSDAASSSNAANNSTAAGSSNVSDSSNTTGSSDILACPAELEAYFQEAAEAYGVSITLLKAIAKAESNFQADATSHSGAMGIMQLMPFTAEELGVSDAYDPHENIMGGAKLISQLLQKYNNNISLAVAAYNAGSGSVDKYGGIPPFTETQNYVEKVLSYYNG